jgi:hypothetical protein
VRQEDGLSTGILPRQNRIVAVSLAALVFGELVPGTGLEPALPFGNLILSQKRLPFRHPGLAKSFVSYQLVSDGIENNIGSVSRRACRSKFHAKGPRHFDRLG